MVTQDFRGRGKIFRGDIGWFSPERLSRGRVSVRVRVGSSY